MNNSGLAVLCGLVVGIFAYQSACYSQGPLTPPGPPAPTMKTLEQVEPRTPITNLPYTITQPGSYYVTTNLTGNPGGITISASGVTLDLMGFELVGGTGDGISVSGSRTNICIRNGTVRGWSGSGVDASSSANSLLQELQVSNNGVVGLVLGDGGRIRDCTARSNVSYGMSGGFGNTISGCTVTYNGSDGINASYSTVSGCTARSNTGNGISATSSTVSGCAATSNTGRGISAFSDSTVSGCTASINIVAGITADTGSTISGCTASNNPGDGIQVVSSCQVVNNTCQGNGFGAGGGAGINATSSRNRIDSNTVMGNITTGIKCNPASANLIIRNSARGNGVNYDIVAGNNSGAIILNPGVGFASTNPWANFEF